MDREFSAFPPQRNSNPRTWSSVRQGWRISLFCFAKDERAHLVRKMDPAGARLALYDQTVLLRFGHLLVIIIDTSCPSSGVFVRTVRTVNPWLIGSPLPFVLYQLTCPPNPLLELICAELGSGWVRTAERLGRAGQDGLALLQEQQQSRGSFGTRRRRRRGWGRGQS